MTFDQERAIFSLFAVVKSPLFIGADVITLSGHSLKTYLNKEVIAVNQDPLGARGGLVRPPKFSDAGEPEDGEVWAVELSGGSRCIVLLNRDPEKEQNITVTWAEVGFETTGKMHVRDLWAHTDLGDFATGFTAASVRPTSALVVRVSPSH